MNKQCNHEYGAAFQIKDTYDILQRRKCKKCGKVDEVKLDKSGIREVKYNERD